MPLLRATIVIAVIFAFSPVRDGGPPPVRGAPGNVPEIAAAPVEQPTIESLIRGSMEPDGRAARAYDDALAARDAWRALPDEAQDALARLVAEELQSGIYGRNR